MTADAWQDPVAVSLYMALQEAGVDTTTFGAFGRLIRQTVNYDLAASVLVGYLPRVSDPNLKDAVVRSLAGQSGRNRLGGAALVYEFTDPRHSSTLRWSIGNTLATVAAPSDAEGVRSALIDSRWGTARQMLCDALVRTKDPAGPDLLLSLLEDDDVAGHAISALRRTAAGRSALASSAGMSKLSRVTERATSTEYAKRAARRALRLAAAVTDIQATLSEAK